MSEQRCGCGAARGEAHNGRYEGTHFEPTPTEEGEKYSKSYTDSEIEQIRFNAFSQGAASRSPDVQEAWFEVKKREAEIAELKAELLKLRTWPISR
jgi:hypothetical protein